jgi:hypothetical protein
MRFQTSLVLMGLIWGLGYTEADAMFRGGGGRMGGGVRVGASTTFRPGEGVTRSTTVAGGRYHTPATLPDLRPGVAPPGSAIRTVNRVTRRVARRTARGYTYYLGVPIVALPSSACYAVIWEGMTAYNCGGVLYVYEDSQYYPIEGA